MPQDGYMHSPEEPKLGLRVGVPMEDGRQLDITAWVDRDDPDEVLDRILDKITRAANRQKAINSLPELRSQRTSVADKAARLREDLAACDARFAVRFQMLDEQTERVRADLDNLISTETEKHYGSGRSGEFKWQGAAKATATRYQDALEKHPAEKGKIDAEWQVERSQKAALLKDAEAGIEALERQIAAYEKMARGEPIV
jgi:DNA repair exonuclease SbcCD ATPase subunit